MSTYNFLVVASGLDHEASNFEDRLVEAGCDDATVAFQRGLILLEFDRNAADFSEALWSAVEDVQGAGATVRRVEPDDLVSLADMARRAEMTRAAVSNYFAGTRGEGFPVPVAKIGTDNPLWRWSEVAGWLHDRGRLSAEAVEQARLIAFVNSRLAEGAPLGEPPLVGDEVEVKRAAIA